jgi:hypothetical protein
LDTQPERSSVTQPRQALHSGAGRPTAPGLPDVAPGGKCTQAHRGGAAVDLEAPRRALAATLPLMPSPGHAPPLMPQPQRHCALLPRSSRPCPDGVRVRLTACRYAAPPRWSPARRGWLGQPAACSQRWVRSSAPVPRLWGRERGRGRHHAAGEVGLGGDVGVGEAGGEVVGVGEALDLGPVRRLHLHGQQPATPAPARPQIARLRLPGLGTRPACATWPACNTPSIRAQHARPASMRAQQHAQHARPAWTPWPAACSPAHVRTMACAGANTHDAPVSTHARTHRMCQSADCADSQRGAQTRSAACRLAARRATPTWLPVMGAARPLHSDAFLGAAGPCSPKVSRAIVSL